MWIENLLLPLITFIYCYNITGNPVKAETSNEYLNDKDKTYYYVNGDITVTGTMNLALPNPFLGISFGFLLSYFFF